MTGPTVVDRLATPAGTGSWMERADAWLRRRPKLMLTVTIMAAVVATLILLAQPQGAIVLYQAF